MHTYTRGCTWIRRHLKETVLWGTITWSVLGKQNIQAKKVHLDTFYGHSVLVLTGWVWRYTSVQTNPSFTDTHLIRTSRYYGQFTFLISSDKGQKLVGPLSQSWHIVWNAGQRTHTLSVESKVRFLLSYNFYVRMRVKLRDSGNLPSEM